MIEQVAEMPKLDDEVTIVGELEATKERRLLNRILAFCQVIDLERNFVGISWNVTFGGICLSLPNTWTKAHQFSIILKRADQPSLPEVTISVEPIWRKSYNESFDEIAGKIVQVDSPQNFEMFLKYCQEAGPSGLVDKD